MQSGLHCKVECNKEIRRFLFNGTEFGSLYEQIKQLFGLQREFVLKYKDEEGDMVTVSTTEELSFATSCLVPSQALRLEVTVTEKEQTAPVEVKTDKKACRKWGGGGGHSGNGEWKKARIQGYLERLQSMPETDSNREWRANKIQHLQTKLAYIESAQQGQTAGGAGPSAEGWQARGNNHIQAKKEKITAKIEQLSSIPQNEGNVEARQKKIEKLKSKLAWIEKRQACMQSGGGGKQLSAEEKAQFEAKKAQAKQIRQNMCNLRAQIHQKKGEWHMAPKENKEAISKEIGALKEQMKAQKEQLFSLKSHC